jgi:hypothetical protein
MTTGGQFVIGWWYRRAAVFFLPPTWLGPLTWWLSFPFAPAGASPSVRPLARRVRGYANAKTGAFAGSVSCGVWQMACRRVIRVAERTVRDLLSSSGASFLRQAGAEADIPKACRRRHRPQRGPPAYRRLRPRRRPRRRVAASGFHFVVPDVDGGPACAAHVAEKRWEPVVATCTFRRVRDQMCGARSWRKDYVHWEDPATLEVEVEAKPVAPMFSLNLNRW